MSVLRDSADKAVHARVAGVAVEGRGERKKDVPEDLDRQLAGFEDLEHDPLGDLDPAAGLKAKYGAAGMSLKLLSPNVNGTLGARGYRIVKDGNGAPVTCGKMLLGEIPTKYADIRRKAAIERANEQIRNVNESRRDNIEKMRAEAGALGCELIEAGESVRDLHTGQDRAAGITVERVEAR